MENLKSTIIILYIKETGLISVSQYGQTVELCIEDIQDINEFVKGLGTDQIANREDFI